ncbi:MAG TPA: hypothetical protein VE684_05045 [Crenalkalicoccus sp.]|nr:hypothetical protein [Crenalkalicoccus sp.]
MIARRGGRAVAVVLAPGQPHEQPMAPGLRDRLPELRGWAFGESGPASDAFRDPIWDIGVRPAIPPKCTAAPIACPPWIPANRASSRTSERAMEWRAVASRCCEKTVRSFLDILFAAPISSCRQALEHLNSYRDLFGGSVSDEARHPPERNCNLRGDFRSRPDMLRH